MRWRDGPHGLALELLNPARKSELLSRQPVAFPGQLVALPDGGGHFGGEPFDLLGGRRLIHDFGTGPARGDPAKLLLELVALLSSPYGSPLRVPDLLRERGHCRLVEVPDRFEQDVVVRLGESTVNP